MTPTPTTIAAPARSAGFDRPALDLLLAADSAAWARDRRRAAFERLQALPLPDRRDENWMRTDLRLFRPTAWRPSPRPAAAAVVPAGLLAACLAGDAARDEVCFDDSDRPVGTSAALAGRLESLDGHVLRDELDPALAARGVVFGAAERLLETHADVFQRHWFATIDSGCDWFAAMHAAFHAASAVLYVPPGVKIEAPLHVLSGIGEGGVDTAHVLVVLGEGAEATVLTETAGGASDGGPGSGLHCGGTEIVVGRGASLRMVNLQNWSTGVWHFARQRAVVHEQGRLQWTLGALGSRLSQVAQEVALVGRGASAQVNGVMFTEGRQQLVYNTLQHHWPPAAAATCSTRAGCRTARGSSGVA